MEYSLASLGATLTETIDGLRVWAETRIEDVLKAQSRYDGVR